MKQRPDLNILAQQVFEANKIKGFHDTERSNETLLMLVITELSEAVEADRKEKRADFKEFENRELIYHNELSNIIPNGFAYSFEWAIKDTLEDELADAVIRLLDLAGLRGFDEPLIYSKKDQKEHFTIAYKNYSDKSFSELIYATVATLFSCKTEFTKIKQCLLSIEWICEHLSIDLWQHVELKLQYNATRPHKHGKAY